MLEWLLILCILKKFIYIHTYSIAFCIRLKALDYTKLRSYNLRCIKIFKRHEIENHSDMFRIVCDPSSGSIELYLTEIRSGSYIYIYICRTLKQNTGRQIATASRYMETQLGILLIAKGCSFRPDLRLYAFWILTMWNYGVQIHKCLKSC